MAALFVPLHFLRRDLKEAFQSEFYCARGPNPKHFSF